MESGRLPVPSRRRRPTGPIYRSNADGTGTVELTQGYHPVWSPDGASIVFQRETPGSTMSESDIFVIRPDGTGERRLTTSPEFREVWPSWSPDGARILFSRWAHRWYGGLSRLPTGGRHHGSDDWPGRRDRRRRRTGLLPRRDLIAFGGCPA